MGLNLSPKWDWVHAFATPLLEEQALLLVPNVAVQQVTYLGVHVNAFYCWIWCIEVYKYPV